jgi:LacI family transcriptional regulator
MAAGSPKSSAPPRRITMADIAARAGVSRPLVSAALGRGRGTIGVSAKTRERIEAICQELNYRVHATARATRSGRTGSIALLKGTGASTSYRPQQLIDGIHHEAQAHNLSLILDTLADEKLTSEGFVPKMLRELACDGMLINYQHHIPTRMLELIRQHHVPSVWLNSKQPANCVHIDDLGGGEALTNHLLQLGHRRIVYVDFSHPSDLLPTTHYSAHDRAEGYCHALRAAGLEPRVRRPTVAFTPPQRLEMARQILRHDQPTALITYASGHLHLFNIAALELGWRIPTDLSVASFDARWFNEFAVGVTVAKLDYAELGRRATRMLLQRIQDPHLSLPCASVACPVEPDQSTRPPRERS